MSIGGETRCGGVAKAISAVVVIGLCGAVLRLHAQAPAAFEVASIKPNASVDETGRMMVSPGMFRATNVNARALALIAYGADGRSLLQQQLIGGPAWMSSERYNVIGKGGAEVRALRDAAPMVRLLLEERFQLRAHRERRLLGVYVLTRARLDGTPGAALRASTVNCNDPVQRAQAAAPSTASSWCGSRFLDGEIHAGGYSMSALTSSLSAILKNVVIDETGLSGSFDFDLEWNQDPAAVASDKPSLFTAVQEQLGLKLVSKDADVDVVVIDSIQRPSPD